VTLTNTLVLPAGAHPPRTGRKSSPGRPSTCRFTGARRRAPSSCVRPWTQAAGSPRCRAASCAASSWRPPGSARPARHGMSRCMRCSARACSLITPGWRPAAT
jgi:hypothetical protein